MILRVLLLWIALTFCGALPAQAHLPVQLFQGAEVHERGVVRALPPELDLGSRARLPGGLYQIPPEFEVEVELETGAHRGQRVRVPHVLFGNPSADVVPEVGLRVIVGESRLADGRMLYKILDYDRRPALIGSSVLGILALVLVGGLAGLRALGFALGGLALLYLVTLPALIEGGPPALVTLLSAGALLVGGTWLSLGRSLEARSALLGSGLGALAGMLVLVLTFGWGHVSGLATPDALVLYSQVKEARTLDYTALWRSGALLTSLGAILLMSVLTARAIGREPTVPAWEAGLREGRAFLAPMAIGTALLYFGLSLPLLMITHLDRVTPIRISGVRFMNYDYLVAVTLSWQAGLVGLIVAWVGTCAAAKWLRRRLEG